MLTFYSNKHQGGMKMKKKVILKIMFYLIIGMIIGATVGFIFSFECGEDIINTVVNGGAWSILGSIGGYIYGVCELLK